MGFDLHLVPPTGFREWSEAQWDEYFSQDPYPESEKLGRSGYVAIVLEAIFHNLEDDKRGSRYPLFARIDRDELVGWDGDEVQPLMKELQQIQAGLSRLPLNRATVHFFDDEGEFQRWVSECRQHSPGRTIERLYDVCRDFMECFIAMAEKALMSGQGLFVSY
jgi:hypothetical protein